MKKLLLLVSLPLLFILVPPYAEADTYVTENITQDTTWSISGSPYVISSDVQVYGGVKLIINPGVEVRFNQGAGLIVAGELKAVGTTYNSIKFTSNSLTPLQGDWKYIKFLDTAITTAYQPNFEYDYDNYQILLNYSSGSIFDYCIIEYADIGILTIDIYPGVKNSNIKNCNVGMSIDTSHTDSPVGIEKWFYFYGNIVEKCKKGLAINTTYNNHAIISNNAFIENEYYGLASTSATKAYRGWESGMMLFNNQFINNIGTAIQIATGESAISPPFVFLEHNNVTFNGKGAAVQAYLVAMHNYIAHNRSFSYLVSDRYVSSDGGGLILYGPEGYLFNNTIQQNGVDAGGHGDGIYLSTAMWVFDYERNKFVIRYNNLGNTAWDTFDIYIGSLSDQCSISKELEVDATNNSWMTSNPSDTIYDFDDDACAGIVNYEPTASSVMIPSPLQAHPTLLSPENYSEVEQTPPDHSGGGPISSYNINFSWSSVPTATKYLLCTYGKEYIGNTANNIVEVTNGTSANINSYIYGSDNDHLVHWFVVAGNENGWGLPSEVRHVRIVEPSDDNGDGGGGECATVDNNLNLTIPYAEYSGLQLELTLNHYVNSLDPFGIYWELGNVNLVTCDCDGGYTIVDNALNITIRCFEYNGVQYNNIVILEHYTNPQNPFGLYWKLSSVQ
jgi:hypothetical protein